MRPEAASPSPSLGDEWWYPLWEKMVELDIPGTIHASASVNPAMHTTISYYIAQHHSGAVELLSSRVFQDFPTLKIVIPHGGGAIPYQWNRHRGMHVREGHEPLKRLPVGCTGIWPFTTKRPWSC